jgi:predicted Fe-Mo cluster-binding NifX family protein
MKIAIPTDDGFTIDENFKSAKGFLVSTIESGHIKKQEFRNNFGSEISNSTVEQNQNLADCDTLIVRQIDSAPLNLLELQHKEVVKTEGVLIAEELMHYIHVLGQKESDICCCP